jgi:two-component system, LytTR family, response regulator
MMRALIVDDEAIARRRLRRLCEREGDVEVIGECAAGREAVAAVAEHAPDVLFLDVQMPGLDGFGVLAALGEVAPPERTPAVVFVTAYDEHAVRAFDVHAADYLLKPVDPERFRVAVARVRGRLGEADAARRHAQLVAILGAGAGDTAALPPAPAGLPVASGTPRYRERLLAKVDGRMYFVRAADIDWVEAEGNYVRLHVGREAHLIRETMADLERDLDPATFARIHRSTIVNLDRVREMQPWFSGEYVVILHDGTRLKLSRWYRDRLEARLGR